MAKGIGVTKKDVQASSRKRKRTPAMGFTSKDVKQGKKALEPKIKKRRREKWAKDAVEKALSLLGPRNRDRGLLIPDKYRGFISRAITREGRKRKKSSMSEPMAMAKKGGKIMYGYKAGGKV
jgi:hypothetical protein